MFVLYSFTVIHLDQFHLEWIPMYSDTWNQFYLFANDCPAVPISSIKKLSFSNDL